MSAARARAEADNGRGDHGSCSSSLHARVPVLCMEHMEEKVSGLFAQGTVTYCKDVDLGCSGSGRS